MSEQQLPLVQKEILSFSYNWNQKLLGRRFTTLRMKSGKYTIGQVYEIQLKKEKMLDAVCIDLKELPSIYDIDEYSASLDTGYSKAECIGIVEKMYKNKTEVDLKSQPFYLVLLERIKG